MHLEPLESRIAPAGGLATSINYTDHDGDVVTITASHGPLNTSLLTFTAEHELLNFDVNDPEFIGADIRFSVEKVAGGDGRANVGTIDATGIDLGDVKVKGDLSRFFGGDANTSSPALDKLQARSLGVEKIGAINTSVVGAITSFIIKRDVNAAEVFLHGPNAGDPGVEPDLSSKIEKLVIGGSLIGGATTNDGSFHAEGGFGSIKIKGNMIGGAGDFSARFESDTTIGKIRVGGGVIGGSGEFSAVFDTDNDIGNVFIGGDLKAGTGNGSGELRIDGDIFRVAIGGDLIGGERSDSGLVWAREGGIGDVVIGGDVIGGDAKGSISLQRSGAIIADRSIGDVKIGGKLVSGKDESSGTIKHSGAIIAEESLGQITVGGSVTGNATNRVVISAVGQFMKPATGHDVAIAGLTIGGSLSYTDVLAGYDKNREPDNGDASIGKVFIGVSIKASNIIAGIQDAGPVGFGTGDVVQSDGNTAALKARIASIEVVGNITNVAGGTYAFASQHIGKARINGTNVLLTPGPSNDGSILLQFTGASNYYVEEVA